MTTGIYLLLLGDQRYVGQSVNVEVRWGQHQDGLQQNKHHNGHLQDYYNAHNYQPTFKILKVCPKNELNYWERELGDQYSNVRQNLPEREPKPLSAHGIPWGIILTALAIGVGYLTMPSAVKILRTAPTIAQTKPKQVTVTALANIRATPNGAKLRTVDKGTVLNVATIDPNGWWAIQGGGFVHRSMVK